MSLFSNLQPTLEILIQEQRWDELATIFENCQLKVSKQQDWKDCLAELDKIPASILETHSTLVVVYARALINNILEPETLEFIEKVLPALPPTQKDLMWVEYALALANTGQERKAFDGLTAVLPRLEGIALGVALRRLGRCACVLQLEWKSYFSQSLIIFAEHKRMWGITRFEEGCCYNREKDYNQAQFLFLEALTNFHNDSHSTTWIYYTLGITVMKNGDFIQSGKYLTTAVRLSEHKDAAKLIGTAFLGLASLRRIKGEWVRAEQVYQDALKCATENWDRQRLEIGYLKCLRLRGDLEEAHKRAAAACQEFPNSDALRVAKAAVLAVKRCWKQAQTELEGLNLLRLEDSDQSLYALVRGELCRHAGDLVGMQAALEGINLDALQVREEIRAFPQLFAELGRIHHRLFTPLEVIPLTVEVMAEGTVQVRVSQEPIALPAKGRAAQLLIWLLEQPNKSGTMKDMIEELFEDEPITLVFPKRWTSRVQKKRYR
jgi:tetratricopeptide (TPR) repeat protein